MEGEARVRVKANAVQKSVVEAVTNTKSIEEAERGKIEREEAEARAKAEAEIN